MQTPSPDSQKAQRARLLRLLLLAGGGILGLTVLGRTCGPGADTLPAGKPPQGDSSSKSQAGSMASSLGFDELSIGEGYTTSVASQAHRLGTLDQDVAGLRRTLEALKGALEKAAAVQEAQAARLADLARQVESLGARELPVAALLRSTSPEPTLSRGVREITFEPVAAARAPRRALRIPSASAGEAIVENGVFAPTGGEPSPIRLRLEAALLGPSRSRIPLRNAFLIGKAAGDANATRVTVELISLSMVKPGGQAIEVPVRGYVVGDDGMEGIPGTYLYRLDEQLPLALASEGVAGFAGALAERETTRTLTPLGGATSVVTGDPLRFAGLKAAAGTSAKVGEILSERMREIRPAVWAPAEKRVQVVFLEGVTLEGLTPEETNDVEEHPFRDLDPHR